MSIAKLTLLALIAAAAAAGQAAAGVLPEAVARTIRDNFDATLIDYSSARFRNVYTQADKPPGYFVCGYINSKNRNGGYTGWRPFFTGVPDDQVGVAKGSVGLQLPDKTLSAEQIEARCDLPDRPKLLIDISAELAPPVDR